jgi:hypothetical protein
MAQHDDGTSTRQDHHGPENTPRLRLKRKAPASGYVDGAWWPHSDDLSTELQDLLAVLSVRLGPVSRVSYNLAEWAQTPRKVEVDGRLIRLDGYHRQPPNTLGILDGRGDSTVLLVVPANTGDDDAHSVMMAAATSDDRSTVDSLLAGGQAR